MKIPGFEYDRLVQAEFNLEVLEESLPEGEDKKDLRIALRAIDRVARRQR